MVTASRSQSFSMVWYINMKPHFKSLRHFIAFRNAYLHYPHQWDIFPGPERDDLRYRLWNFSRASPTLDNPTGLGGVAKNRTTSQYSNLGKTSWWLSHTSSSAVSEETATAKRPSISHKWTPAYLIETAMIYQAQFCYVDICLQT